MTTLKQTIGPLAAVVVPGASDRSIVLCHGYGADANDLAPLADYMDPTHQYTWVFPEAPLEIPLGAHMVGRAWFPIPVSDMQRLMDQRDAGVWMNRRPEGLDSANDKLRDFLGALGLPAHKMVLGGFSQGAMVSLDTVLKNQMSCAGVGILSGTLLSQALWQQWAQTMPALSCFQSHGRQDPVLPFALAQELSRNIVAWGWKATTHFFDGGHDIPYPLLGEWMAFVRRVVP